MALWFFFFFPRSFVGFTFIFRSGCYSWSVYSNNYSLGIDFCVWISFPSVLFFLTCWVTLGCLLENPGVCWWFRFWFGLRGEELLGGADCWDVSSEWGGGFDGFSLSPELWPHSHVPWGKEQGCKAQAGNGGSACSNGWVPVTLIVTGQVSLLFCYL